MSLEDRTLALAIQIGKDVRAISNSLVGAPQTQEPDPLTQAIEDLESAASSTDGSSTTST